MTIDTTRPAHTRNNCSKRTGTFSVTCTAGIGTSTSTAGLIVATVWARQYINVSGVVLQDGVNVSLKARPIPNFPATDWQFDGWAVQAQTGDVRGTDISFLAHPSAYRTPSGRIFLTSTANKHAGPGWTAGYWIEPGAVTATALPYPLIQGNHSVIAGA
jgi:hypothetical protein